ncbi:hypothetical protein BDZ89DRAFT_1143070 [Hymenopellis radicata]|nr:hypothetical protein BDZ89DRAFT_1143070 [Hymenopellis radicata]
MDLQKASEVHQYPSARAFIIVFDVVQVGAFSVLVFILVTAMVAKKVTRSWPWFTFMGSALTWTLSYVILIGHQSGPKPSKPLCIMQATFIYSSNVFVGAAVLGMVLELFLKLLAVRRHEKPVLSTPSLAILTLFPYVIFSVMIGWTAKQAFLHPELAQRDATDMFCHIKSSEELDGLQPYAMNALVMLALIIFILAFSAWNGVLTYQHYRRTGYYLNENAIEYPKVSWKDFVRRNVLVILLSIIGVTMSLSGFALVPKKILRHGIWRLPITVSYIMGARMDFLRAWSCVKTPIQPKPHDEEVGVKWEIFDQPENAPPFGSGITPLQVQVEIIVEKEVHK